MASASESPAAETWSRLLSALAALTTAAAAGYLLLPLPLADAFFAAWVLVAVGLALLGAVGAWTGRPGPVWLSALALTALSVVGMWSIGRYVAPAAVLLLGAALLSRRAGQSPREREAAADPPATTERSAPKALSGAAAAIVGAALVYAGAFAGELFGSCARETVGCAFARTHWAAVGVTVLGLIAVGLGGWTLWRQVDAARAPASNRAQ